NEKCNHEDTKTRKPQISSPWFRGFVVAFVLVRRFRPTLARPSRAGRRWIPSRPELAEAPRRHVLRPEGRTAAAGRTRSPGRCATVTRWRTGRWRFDSDFCWPDESAGHLRPRDRRGGVPLGVQSLRQGGGGV